MKKESRKRNALRGEAKPYHQPLTLAAAAHYHHEIGKSVSGPTTDPTHLPLTEAGTDRDGNGEAKEFGFERHASSALTGASHDETVPVREILVSV